jgi:hypothetical protein
LNDRDGDYNLSESMEDPSGELNENIVERNNLQHGEDKNILKKSKSFSRINLK